MELQQALSDVSKQCHQLWEENKDLQGRFVNELGELQRIQLAISQLESENKLDQALMAKNSMVELQRRATTLYEVLIAKRGEIVVKLNDGTNYATMLQVRF